MARRRSFTEAEVTDLIDQLVTTTYRADLTNTYTMGYFVLGTANSMSEKFDRVINRQDVVVEILKLKDRLFNFNWFLGLSGVTYKEDANIVGVTEEYFKQDYETSEALWLPEANEMPKNNWGIEPDYSLEKAVLAIKLFSHLRTWKVGVSRLS